MNKYINKIKCLISLHDFVVIKKMSLSNVVFLFLRKEKLNSKIYKIFIHKDKILKKYKCFRCGHVHDEILDMKLFLKDEIITNKKTKIILN